MSFAMRVRVVNALTFRELRTRITHNYVGFMGLIAGPLLSILSFSVIFTFLHPLHDDSIDPIIFFTTGIVVFTVFSETSVRCVHAYQANEALFFYRQVRPIDTVVSRALVELGLLCLLTIIILGPYIVFFPEQRIDNLPQLFAAVLLTSLFSFGCGVFFMIAGRLFPVVEVFIPMIMRPLWFVSGALFSLSHIPEPYRRILAYNPIIQGVELSRNAFSSNYSLEDTGVSMFYLFTTSLITVVLSLWAYTLLEKRLRKSR
jgi:capsular polysaccharide transport system permease protein